MYHAEIQHTKLCLQILVELCPSIILPGWMSICEGKVSLHRGRLIPEQ